MKASYLESFDSDLDPPPRQDAQEPTVAASQDDLNGPMVRLPPISAADGDYETPIRPVVSSVQPSPPASSMLDATAPLEASPTQPAEILRLPPVRLDQPNIQMIFRLRKSAETAMPLERKADLDSSEHRYDPWCWWTR